MEQPDCREKIRAFVVESLLFGDTEEPFEDDTSFLGAGFIDSTGVLELVAFLEEEFEFAVDDEDLTPENLDSVERVSAYIDRKRSAGETA